MPVKNESLPQCVCKLDNFLHYLNDSSIFKFDFSKIKHSRSNHLEGKFWCKPGSSCNAQIKEIFVKYARFYLIYFSAFVLQRGRVALRLDTEDVRCRKVYFKTGSFQSSRGNVRVQTTINYFNYSGNFIHDAAVTWVENVNLSSFDVCALKAGRLDRLTPDGGLTFVDFIAFQEAPKSSTAGQVIMTNWWDGTQCESVTFEVSLN